MKYNFNESIGFIIVKSGRLIENKMRINFDKANLNITPQQWSVLTHLWSNEGVTQQKLADVFSKDKTSITRLLNNMEKADLIKRERVTKDKRNKKIYVTDRSKLLKEESIKIAEKTLIELLTGIDPKELKLTKKVLKQIVANLN